MSYKFLVLLFVGGVSLAGTAVIVLSFDPFLSAVYVKFLFFSLLFAFLWSLGTFVFYYFNKKENLEFEKAFKKGLLLSLILLAILILLRIKQ